MPQIDTRSGNKRMGYYLLLGVGIVLGLVLIITSEQKNKEILSVGSKEESDLLRAEERRISYLLEEMEGVEAVSVMLKQDEEGKVCGIAVICQDGENAVVQEKIIRLLRALYSLGSHQISVSG